MDSFLWVAFALIFIIASLVITGVIVRTAMIASNGRSFKELANELKEDNTHLKTELAAIKETLASINKMMKDVG